MGTDGFSKHATSPEALAHKVEYDTEYESNPERVKYREELNQERRKRHIMGQGGPDMSHTKTGHIVPEDMHTNRARHFKERGTLKSIDIAMQLLKEKLSDYQRVRQNIGDDGKYMTDGELQLLQGRYEQLHDDPNHPEEYYNLLESIELEQMRRNNQSFDGIGLNEETDFTRSEPMDMTWDVLKKGAMSHVHQIIQDAPTPAHAIQEITNAYGISHGEAVNLISSAMSPQ